MHLHDPIIDGMLMLPDEADRKDALYGYVSYMREGRLPEGLSVIATALLTGNLPAIENSRARAASGKKGGKTRERFEPPTVAEVAAYVAEKGYGFDPEQFVAFYESKGWKVGSQSMRSWKAACTTWQKRHEADGRKEAPSHGEYD